MDFLPSADQLALAEGVHDLLERAFPLDRLFEVADGFDGELWQALDEQGVFALRRPESASGLGLGVADAALVLTELGAACAPGPIVASVLAGALPAGDSAGIAPGDVVTVASPTWSPLLVGHLAVSSALVVVGDDDLRLIRPGDLHGDPVESPLDPLTPLHAFTELPSGEPIGDRHDATRWRLEGAVLTAAFQVGLARRVTEVSVAYAQQREQFGRPISRFQAVKHLCADMYARTELARAAVDAAAVTLDYPEVGDPVRAVAGAKLLADDAASANTRSAIQVHGGMGITWEVPLHFFIKRAWLLSAEWGTDSEHAEALADLL